MMDLSFLGDRGGGLGAHAPLKGICPVSAKDHWWQIDVGPRLLPELPELGCNPKCLNSLCGGVRWEQ